MGWLRAKEQKSNRDGDSERGGETVMRILSSRNHCLVIKQSEMNRLSWAWLIVNVFYIFEFEYVLSLICI